MNIWNWSTPLHTRMVEWSQPVLPTSTESWWWPAEGRQSWRGWSRREWAKMQGANRTFCSLPYPSNLGVSSFDSYLFAWLMDASWMGETMTITSRFMAELNAQLMIYIRKKTKTGRLHNAYSLYRLSHFIPSPFYKNDFPMPKLAMVQASIDLPDADWICYPKNQTYSP